MKYNILHGLSYLRSQWRLLLFTFLILLIAYLGYNISLIMPKGGVWDNHLSDGLFLINGLVPRIATYPIWGYSLLASIFKENIIIFQGVLMLVFCFYWYRSITKIINPNYLHTNLSKFIINPIVVALILIPFVLLSMSYFSNSIASIIIFFSAWLMFLAERKNNGRMLIYYCASGLLIGIAFNFRSEFLLLGALLSFAIIIYGFFKQNINYYFKCAVAFFLPIILTVTPWLLYTNHTVGQPLISATNGGAVMYLGLGTLPNNPWNIIDSQGFVAEEAIKNNVHSTWGIEGDKYFKLQYINSINEHPKYFIKRVLIGWKYMFTNGLYFPNFRKFLYINDNKEFLLLDYLNEHLKLKLGLDVNQGEWNEYESLGISLKDVSLRHYIIVTSEYFLRLLYLIIFLLIFGSCILLSIKTKFSQFISFIFIGHVVYSLFIAGFIQTLTRHTTLLLPIALTTFLILLSNVNISKDLVKK